MRRECQPALSINDKGSWQRVDAPVQLAYRIITEDDAVIHLLRRNVRLDRLPSILVHRNAHDLEALALVLLLEFDEPGDFKGTRAAPGSPEVQHHNLAAQVTQLKRIPVRVLKGKVRSGLSLTCRLGLGLCLRPSSRGLVASRCSGEQTSKTQGKNGQAKSAKVQGSSNTSVSLGWRA
jgi:hypothetical protein